MKRLGWQFLLGLSLVSLSAFFYFVHYLIFRDFHHILIYLVGDIAFIPLEVLLVTLIIHRLLEDREKRSMLKKLNMVIGAFFSELGTELLKHFSIFDAGFEAVRNELLIKGNWAGRDFLEAGRRIMRHEHKIESVKGDMAQLRTFLAGKREFLLRLLENPNLLEHESFTDLLWAVFHLSEELNHRTDVGRLPDADYEHLSGDIKRAYVLLIYEWLAYMRHLKEDYPYLFSLALRTNPFDPEASPEIK